MGLEEGATNNYPLTNITFFKIIEMYPSDLIISSFKRETVEILKVSTYLTPILLVTILWWGDRLCKVHKYCFVLGPSLYKVIEWCTSNFEKFTDAPYSPWSKRAACYTGTCRENPEADQEKGAEIKRNIGHWPYWQWRVNSFRLMNLKKKKTVCLRGEVCPCALALCWVWIEKTVAWCMRIK